VPAVTSGFCLARYQGQDIAKQESQAKHECQMSHFERASDGHLNPSTRRTTMLNRKILFTLAASVAAVGIALSPVAASAKGDHGNHHSGGKHVRHGKHASLHHKKHHPKKHHPKKHHPKHEKHAHHHHKHHKHHHWHHKKYYYPEVETTYESSPTYNYSKPSYTYTKAADPCTCLTKEYTDDGRVLFKDVCTKESAISPPGAKTAEAED
jgi:hypothetical protein